MTARPRSRERTRAFALAVASVAAIVAGVAIAACAGSDDDVGGPDTIVTAVEALVTLPPEDSFFVFDGQSNSRAPDPRGSYPAIVVGQGFPGMPAAVVALPGTSYPTRMVDAEARVDIYSAAHEHTVLFTEGGQADLVEGGTPEEILEDMTTYIEARRAAGFDAVIGQTVPPSALYSPDQEERRLELNDLLRKHHREAGIDALADVAALSPLADATDTDYFSDGVHYTAQAASLVAYEVLEAMGA